MLHFKMNKRQVGLRTEGRGGFREGALRGLLCAANGMRLLWSQNDHSKPTECLPKPTRTLTAMTSSQPAPPASASTRLRRSHKSFGVTSAPHFLGCADFKFQSLSSVKDAFHEPRTAGPLSYQSDTVTYHG